MWLLDQFCPLVVRCGSVLWKTQCVLLCRNVALFKPLFQRKTSPEHACRHKITPGGTIHIFGWMIPLNSVYVNDFIYVNLLCCLAPCLIWWLGSLMRVYFLLICTDYCISSWFSVRVSVATASFIPPPFLLLSPPFFFFSSPFLLFGLSDWNGDWDAPKVWGFVQSEKFTAQQPRKSQKHETPCLFSSLFSPLFFFFFFALSVSPSLGDGA